MTDDILIINTLVESIIVTERARVELGDNFEELRNSIKNRGLLHPIIVNKKDLELVSGFRRLTAHKELGLTHILVRYFEELSTLDKKVLELEENIHAPLTWDERAKLRKQIHLLYQEQHGKAVKGHDSEGWGQQKTADALGISLSALGQDLQLIEAIRIFPDIKKLTSRRQALKAVDRIKETAILAELANRDIAEKGGIKIPYILYHGDSVEYIKDKIDNETIDLVIFDPPWGIDIHRIASSRGPRGTKTSYKDDTEEAAVNITQKLLPELYRVMKKDAHMYMFIGIQFKDFYIDLLTGFEQTIEICKMMAEFHPELKKAYDNLRHRIREFNQGRTWRFHVEPVPLIWVKEGGGFTDFETKFMPRYETVLFCSKGDKKTFNEAVSNVFEFNRPATTERIHTQEKPIELIEKFIKISTQPNEIVLDPCAGSFATSVAATLMGRRSIAIDNDEECYLRGLNRMTGIMGKDEEGDKE
jgi:site-specific DNA-methyltransferase (adenine-specific)